MQLPPLEKRAHSAPFVSMPNPFQLHSFNLSECNTSPSIWRVNGNNYIELTLLLETSFGTQFVYKMKLLSLIPPILLSFAVHISQSIDRVTAFQQSLPPSPLIKQKKKRTHNFAIALETNPNHQMMNQKQMHSVVKQSLVVQWQG